VNSAIRLEEWSFKRSIQLKVIWFSLVKPLILLNYREYREHVKDLSCLSKNPCRIVLVDNNPFSFLLQPLNGIPCIPFTAGQPHDTQVPRFVFDIPVSLHQLISSSSLHFFYLFIYHLTWWSISFWMSSFHSLSTSLSRKMWDLCSTKGSICLNGFKSKESLFLLGRCSINTLWQWKPPFFVQYATISLSKGSIP
jgi:hypothetical protein